MSSPSRLMQERIRRTTSLLSELGIELEDPIEEEQSWAAAFSEGTGFEGSVSIEHDSKFLEISCTFTFRREQQDFIRDRMDEFMQVCYQYGCYTAIITTEEEIAISLFSKLYFAGLQYYALKETFKDLRNAVEELRVLFDIRAQLAEGEADGYS